VRGFENDIGGTHFVEQQFLGLFIVHFTFQSKYVVPCMVRNRSIFYTMGCCKHLCRPPSLRKVGKGLKLKVSEKGLLKKIFRPEMDEVRQGVVG